jgi:hypothetical protein
MWEQIQSVLDLRRHPVPQLDWEVSIGGSERGYECIFPCLVCLFGCVHSVIMRLHQLQFTLLFGEELLDMLCGLIVHDFELDLETFCGESVELFLICLKDGNVVKPRNRYGKNSIGFIMIHD